jgi:hypothetical protein
MGEPFYLETTMKKYVIVATKGRASEVGHLLDALLEQTCLADGIYVIGSEPADLADLNAHPIHLRTRVRLLISATPGTTFQRNRGIDALLKDQDVESYDPSDEAWFAVFFDDDFRPARNWLDACAEVFGSERRVVAVTGRLLADGIKGPGLTEEQAHAYLSGALPPQAHWASGDAQRAVSCVYGCNMAFTDRVIRTCRFDEALPLYGWQEDQDFTGQAARLGKVVYEPGCVGPSAWLFADCQSRVPDEETDHAHAQGTRTDCSQPAVECASQLRGTSACGLSRTVQGEPAGVCRPAARHRSSSAGAADRPVSGIERSHVHAPT